ncbi:hypothetical protein OAX78_02295 [Planctomycetota bacterium]|nr:hypothetical protein [Planctomycetota bacterium]
MDSLINAAYEVDRNVATALFGHKPGRPTVSRRAGGVVSRATGVSEDTGTSMFHLGLGVGTAFLLSKAAKRLWS